MYRQVSQRNLIVVEAAFQVNLHLTCGVTLEDFSTEISETMTQDFSTTEIIPQDEGEDVPEYIEGREMDLVDVLAQLIAVNIEPYPRKPDADLAAVVSGKVGVNEEEQKENPFAKLADLKGKL